MFFYDNIKIIFEISRFSKETSMRCNFETPWGGGGEL